MASRERSSESQISQSRSILSAHISTNINFHSPRSLSCMNTRIVPYLSAPSWILLSRSDVNSGHSQESSL